MNFKRRERKEQFFFVRPAVTMLFTAAVNLFFLYRSLKFHLMFASVRVFHFGACCLLLLPHCVCVSTACIVMSCVPVRQSYAEDACLRSVFAARGRLPMTVPSCTHLYAVPALCLQLDVWYGEDRRHCRGGKEEETQAD